MTDAYILKHSNHSRKALNFSAMKKHIIWNFV